MPDQDQLQHAAPRWVLLRHILRPGDSHFDLLILPAGLTKPLPDDRCLMSLRLPGDTRPLPDQIDCEGFMAEPMAAHRARYLTYEGPVSGGRGRVERVSGGPIGLFAEDRHQVLVQIEQQRFAAKRVPTQLLPFERVWD